jgi:hypothetical protein
MLQLSYSCSWERTELDKGIRPRNSVDLGPINFLEFPLQLLEILVREFLRIRSLAESKITHASFYDVAEKIQLRSNLD